MFIKKIGNQNIGVCRAPADRLRCVSDTQILRFIRCGILGGSPHPLSCMMHGQMIERNCKQGTVFALFKLIDLNTMGGARRESCRYKGGGRDLQGACGIPSTGSVCHPKEKIGGRHFFLI